MGRYPVEASIPSWGIDAFTGYAPRAFKDGSTYSAGSLTRQGRGSVCGLDLGTRITGNGHMGTVENGVIGTVARAPIYSELWIRMRCHRFSSASYNTSYPEQRFFYIKNAAKPWPAIGRAPSFDARSPGWR